MFAFFTTATILTRPKLVQKNSAQQEWFVATNFVVVPKTPLRLAREEPRKYYKIVEFRGLFCNNSSQERKESIQGLQGMGSRSMEAVLIAVLLLGPALPVSAGYHQVSSKGTQS